MIYPNLNDHLEDLLIALERNSKKLNYLAIDYVEDNSKNFEIFSHFLLKNSSIKLVYMNEKLADKLKPVFPHIYFNASRAVAEDLILYKRIVSTLIKIYNYFYGKKLKSSLKY